ncbi:MAG: transglutaminase-like domain-containing protein [Terriglobia bacterium]
MYSSAAGVGAFQTKTFMLPDGDPGTAKTIRLIRQLVAEGIRDPRIRRAAVEILHQAGIQAHDEPGEVRAVYNWVLRNIRFTKDMVDREMLQPAADILATRAGDCDCINAILLPALLGSIGYATKAVTIKANPDDPESFSHVFLAAYLPASGQWVTLDAARQGAGWGVSPESYWAIEEWPLTDSARSLGYFPRPRPRTSYRRGLRGLRGLGQLPADITSILQSVPSIETGAAQIVAASNMPTYPAYSVYPTTAGYPAGYPYGNTLSVSSSISPVVWIAGGLLLVLTMVKK